MLHSRLRGLIEKLWYLGTYLLTCIRNTAHVVTVNAVLGWDARACGWRLPIKGVRYADLAPTCLSASFHDYDVYLTR